MSNLFNTIINRIGNMLPKKIQRYIADSPGILKCFEKLSKNNSMEFITPEGDVLVMNSLFHYSMIQSGNLSDYEPEVRNAIVKLTKPGMVAYDVGANIGVFSFLFASIVGENGIVYSFEPEENNYSCFEKSLEKYNKKNIVLNKTAVGKSIGTAKFDRLGGAFSGRIIADGSYAVTKNIKKVETINIDYLVQKKEYRIPDIIKIDVEGNENLVLQGMTNVLKEYSPIIICELHGHLGDSVESLLGLLTSFGYTISNIKDTFNDNHVNTELSNTHIGRHIIARKITK